MSRFLQICLLFLGGAAAVTCLGPQILDGQVACSEGLCPEGFECGADTYCYRNVGICNDGVLDPGELCDPCFSQCDDGNLCTLEVGSGEVDECSFRCLRQTIEVCGAGDGCCPAGCIPDDPGTVDPNEDPREDLDCLASCGNGELDPGESCDPPQFPCAVDCSDGDACTTDTRVGSDQNCNLGCANLPIVSCISGDFCCPQGCNHNNDNDCSATCGNEELDPGETCDPPASCPRPVDCIDGIACTLDLIQGSKANCNSYCSNPPIVSCVGGDGCCPTSCNFSNDSDCPAQGLCGNGDIDAGETCDPPASCPRDCKADDPCIPEILIGDPDGCTSECVPQPITDCSAVDGCCPENCASAEEIMYFDPDCGPTGPPPTAAK